MTGRTRGARDRFAHVGVRRPGLGPVAAIL